MPAYRDPTTGQFVSKKDIIEHAPPKAPPKAEPTGQDVRDATFMQQARGQQVDETPEIETDSLDGAEDTTGGDTATGAALGARLGPLGAAAGAAAGFLYGRARSSSNRPIGAPAAAGNVQSGEDETLTTLQEMLAVQKDMIQRGLATRDMVTTNATDSRI